MYKGELRTLGLYQPFASLMSHGKIETRWVREGNKPPFPLGRYLFYSTKEACSSFELFQWCGDKIMLHISNTLAQDKTKHHNGYALSLGFLTDIYEMRKQDEERAFVKFKGSKVKEVVDYKKTNKVGELYFHEVTYIQYCLLFENVTPIEPFKWEYGKQGIGFVPQEEYSKIKLINSQPPTTMQFSGRGNKDIIDTILNG